MRPRQLDRGRDEGYSLIELLTVIVILGILAAIAVPLLVQETSKARTATAKADVNAINKEVFTAVADGPVTRLSFSVATAVLTWTNADASVGSTALKVSPGNTLALTGDATSPVLGGTSYCVTVTSTDGVAWHAGALGELPGTGAGNC